MTGKALYDKFCSARKAMLGNWLEHVKDSNLRATTPVAWQFLPWREQNLWSDLARRVSPRRPK